MQAMAASHKVGHSRDDAAGKSDQVSEFQLIYDAYYTKVFAFIYSRVQQVELAKDLVAETFERAYVKGHTVRDAQAYGAWLFMVAKNLITAQYRRVNREQRREARATDALRCQETTPGPEEFVLRGERINSLMQQVRRLPAREQQLISLKFDAELTNAEIGHVMGMSALNVRVTIFRALRKLRAAMEAENPA